MQEDYLKDEIENFIKYIETEKALLEEIEKKMENYSVQYENELKNESREFKRFFNQYTKLGKSFELSKKYTTLLKNHYDEIIDFFNNENYKNEDFKLDTDFNINGFIYDTILYYKETHYSKEERLEKTISRYRGILDEEVAEKHLKNVKLGGIDQSVPKYLIKLFIKNLKSQNLNSELLSCFDDNGDIILEKTIILNIVLAKIYEDEKSCTKKTKYSTKIEIEKDEFIFTLINKEDLEKAREISREKTRIELEEKRKKIEEVKRKELEKIEKLRAKSIHNKQVIKKEKKEDPKNSLFIKYINPYTHNLKADVVGKLSYDEFNNILSKLDLTKAEINTYLEEYEQIQFEKNIVCLLRLFDQKSDLKRFKETIKDPSINENLYKEIRAFVLQNNFNQLNDKQRKTIITRIINENTLSSNQEIQNLIVLSEESLLENEKEAVYNGKRHGDKNEAIKSIYNHLLALKISDINNIKANKEDAFHELLHNSGEELVIDNKIKLYRYGARKIKIGLAIISATEENKKKLQEKYNTGVNSNILLVFGAGSVMVETEPELYSRIKKYCLNNSERLIEIYDIFANPFTDETFEIACDLIDNSFIKIDDIKPKEKELVLETK